MGAIAKSEEGGTAMLFLGVDVGTQGVRCAVADEDGRPRAGHAVAFARMNLAQAPDRYEQSPADWWDAAAECIAACCQSLRAEGLSGEEIAAISIDGTSGTIAPLDENFQPLTDALMYNDPRARDQAARVHAAMGAHEAKMGFAFNASFSLPRILWLLENEPEVCERTRVFAHQADTIAGRLCGEYCVSDFSNALKTGYDLIAGRWPREIAALGLDEAKLPRVVAPGAPIAHVTKEAARALGLSPRALVVGGSTDGYASALAAGAIRPGDWASIIGTTFVLKGVTEKLVIDPGGGSYSHRLPSGAWLLGGASNLGGRCLNAVADPKDFARLDGESEKLIPTGARCYPLTGVGERFPFVDYKAQPFYIGDILGGKLYPALMEGVGFAERLAISRMEALGLSVGEKIFTTGGACKSDLWLKIRAAILNRRLLLPAQVDAAMGSAILAASNHYGSLEKASDAMLRIAKHVDPDQRLADRYAEIYAQFAQDCARMYEMGDQNGR